MPKVVPRYLRSRRAERRVAGEELWWPAPGTAGVIVTEDTSLKLSSVLAAIVGLAQDVAALPVNCYQRLPDGGRREAKEHSVEELLTRSPDGETTPILWRAALMGSALLRGNGYAEIQRKGNGRPMALHLLDQKTTRADRRNGRLGYNLGNGGWLPAEDVLHLAGFGLDGLSGVSFPKLLNQGIGVGLAAEGYAADYFANGAEPGGLIEHPQKMTTEALKNFKEGWDLKHRGAGNRHTPAILQQGAKWTSTGVNPEQSQLVETRKFQANDVTRPWRVPPHKIGDFSQAHLANIEASNLDYLQTALMWWLECYEQQMLLKLFTRTEWAAGYYVEHNVNALLRGDITSRFNAYGKALGDGWLNRDEVRKRENLNPIGPDGGGEKYLVPLNMGTLEAAGKTPPAPAAARSTRFNPHHDPGSGKFTSGSGGGGGGPGQGDYSAAAQAVESAAAATGLDLKLETALPANGKETKFRDKTHAAGKEAVVVEAKPQLQSVPQGDHTQHYVGGRLATEARPAGSDPIDAEMGITEGWVNQHYGADGSKSWTRPHKTRAAAEKEARLDAEGGVKEKTEREFKKTKSVESLDFGDLAYRDRHYTTTFRVLLAKES